MSVVLRESRCVDCGKFIPEGSVRCARCAVSDFALTITGVVAEARKGARA